MRRLASSSLVGVSVGLVVAAGCASANRALANKVLPVEQEEELGRQMEAELEKELTFVQDPEVVGYVRAMGERIVAAAGDDIPQGIEFKFDVVQDDETVNAFAIPGGHIYIYTGLLRLVEDESELMGVVGHEVAHVTQRHIAQQLTAQYGLQTLAAIALGQNPGLLGQLVGAAVGQGAMLKYSRDAEREADHVGIGYEAKAGWDPRGMIRFFAKMNELSGGDPGVLVLLQTHPASEERMKNAEERLADLGNLPTETGRERYQAFLQRLGGPRPQPAATQQRQQQTQRQDAAPRGRQPAK
jgi:predicted Zn-dependent protease